MKTSALRRSISILWVGVAGKDLLLGYGRDKDVTNKERGELNKYTAIAPRRIVNHNGVLASL